MFIPLQGAKPSAYTGRRGIRCLPCEGIAMDDETQQLIGLVHQLANGALVQARKLEELQKRIEKLEYERRVNAVGATYGGLNVQG